MNLQYFYRVFSKFNFLNIYYNKYFLLFKNEVDKSVFLIYNYLNVTNIKFQNRFFYFHDYKVLSKFKINVKKYVKNLLKGFCIIIDVIGLGYYVTKSKLKDNLLRLSVGHNHCVYYYLPKGCFFRTKRRQIFLFSFSYFLLKNVSIDILNFRKLSIYKLKGIKLKDVLYKKKN